MRVRFFEEVLPVLFALALVAMITPARAAACACDCDADRTVEVTELILAIRVALDPDLSVPCRDILDVDRSGRVGINDVIMGVADALNGCEFCPRVDRPYEAACTMPIATARCSPNGTVVGGLPLPGLSLDSDGRFVRLEMLDLEPGLVFFADVAGPYVASIYGVQASRFGIIEPASGSIRLNFDDRGNQTLNAQNVVPQFIIDDCQVLQYFGRFE